MAVSTTVIYAFYIEQTAGNLEYRKSTTSGASWAAPVTVRDEANALVRCAVWYDKWTPGDTGVLIHIVTFGSTDDDVDYYNLNTSTDSLSTPVVAFAGVSSGTSSVSSTLSITKAAGGNLYVWFDIDGGTETGFYRSTDGGANWTSRASPFEATLDSLLLFPANLADTNDIWALYHDASADQLSLKTYDDSANSWAENAIATLVESTRTNTQFQFNGSVRHSDGHLIVALANNYNNAAQDVEVWDIANGGSMTQKTNVITNIADQNAVAVFIDQVSDDIYVSYLGAAAGTETWGTDTKAYYKKSTDGGGTWGSEAAYGVTGGNYRILMSDLGSATCRFIVAWEDNTNSDLITNSDNSIAIGGTTALTPSPITIPLSVAAPTLTLTYALTPSPVTVPLTVAEPVLSLTYPLTPDAVAIPLVIPDPVVQVDRTITPDPVVITISIPEPSIGIPLTPDPIAIPLVVADPVISLTYALTPDPVAITLAVAAPTLSHILSLAPDPIAIPLALASPTLSLVLGLTPLPVEIELALPDPLLQFTIPGAIPAGASALAAVPTGSAAGITIPQGAAQGAAPAPQGMAAAQTISPGRARAANVPQQGAAHER